MKKEIYFCDVCKKSKDVRQGVKLQVIFTTDQTEGKSSGPYLDISEIDVCRNCMNKILEGNYLFAKGAQGYNDYYFRQEV